MSLNTELTEEQMTVAYLQTAYCNGKCGICRCSRSPSWTYAVPACCHLLCLKCVAETLDRCSDLFRCPFCRSKHELADLSHDSLWTCVGKRRLEYIKGVQRELNYTDDVLRDKVKQHFETPAANLRPMEVLRHTQR